MAIEFARCVVYSRSEGKNAVRAAAYRSASRLYDERTDRWFNYTKKPNVDYSEIILPEGADAAFLNRQYLWNQVEHAEKRRDSQLAKDYILALPKELSLEHNIELAREFAHHHFVRHGVVVDLNIHMEDGNPHAHLLVTTRRLLGKTFSLKARDLNPEFYNRLVIEKDYWGTEWRNFQNQFFKSHELDLAVDPNHLVPIMHRGRKMEDGRAEYIDEINGLVHEGERELALHHPAVLLNMLSQQYAVFNEKELACVIHKATDTAAEYEQALTQIKAHPDLIQLGPGDDGRMRFTTRQAATLEWDMEDQAIKLAAKQDHLVPLGGLTAQIKKYGLNQGQQNALKHVLLGDDLALIVGKAGTGKSYMMNAAREVWEAQKYRVIGISVAGIAAESLESGSNIKSSTIAAFKLRIEKGYLTLSEKDIIVLDEAGMVDNRDLSFVINQVKAAGAKLVMIGDPGQVQPVGIGAPFRALLEKIGFVELTEIQRQKRPEDKIATNLLSIGKTAAAIDIYAHKGQVFLSETEQDSLAMLLSKWTEHINYQGKDRMKSVMNETIILAHRNEDVKMLNTAIREHLIKEGLLTGQSQNIKTKTEALDLMIGDRILFLENSTKLNVKNGHFATITAINDNSITAEIGVGDKIRCITFDIADYNNFTYGYAATVHKTQGVTVDNAFLYAGGKYWSRNLTYVGLSRHRDNVYLFADKETHSDFDTLKKHLGRLSIKDAVIDYPLNYAIRRGLEPEGVLDQFFNTLNQVKDKIKDKWGFVANVEAFNDKLEQVQKDQAQKQQRRQDAVRVAEYVDLHHAVGRGFATMKQSLKSGQDLAEHESFSAIYNQMTERNRLAHQLYQDTSKYELALELNNVEITDLQRYSKQHEAREQILAYQKAAKNGGTLTAGKVAESIVSDGKAHGLYMRERGLNWEAVYTLAKDYRKREFYHQLGPLDQALYKDISRYQSLNRDSAKAWGRVFTEQHKQKLDQWQSPKAFTANNDHKIKIAKGFSQERDELAFKIQENINAYTPFIEHFKINRHRLEKAAAHYQKVQERQKQQNQQNQASCQVVDGQLVLSAPMLEKVSQYLEIRQKVRNRAFASFEENQAGELLQYERAKILQAESSVWEQAKALIPNDDKIRLLEPDILKAEIEQNRFMPESLKTLNRDIGLRIDSYEYDLQKQAEAAKAKEAEALKPKPEFWVDKNKIRLNEPLLADVRRYVELKQKLSADLSEVNMLVMKKEDSARIKQLDESLKAGRAEDLALSTELAKKAELWKQADSMTTQTQFSDKLKLDELKMNAQSNSFEAKNLQLLGVEARYRVRGHEMELEQNLRVGRGIRF